MQITADLERQLRMLVSVFLAENQNLNLSAHRTEESCWIGNVLDSLAAHDFISSLVTRHSCPSGRRAPLAIMDVGTGGGFPLLPLAITLPEHDFTGIDATQKKIDAVQRIADRLELRNVRLNYGRAESLGHDAQFREQYDLALTRALSSISTDLEYCSPFVKPEGRIILWKSMSVNEELAASTRAQSELSCSFRTSHIYELPEGFGQRQLLIFEKTAALLEKYPRRTGLPAKRPL